MSASFGLPRATLAESGSGEVGAVLRFGLSIEKPSDDIAFSTSCARLRYDGFAEELGLDRSAGALHTSHQDFPLVDPFRIGWNF